MLDPTPLRRAAAEGLGLTALDPDRGDVAVALKSRWRRAPGDRGADVVFQCRGRSAALALALRLLRPQGTVIDLAFYTDDGARAAAGRGVPPQRARRAHRADRPGAAWHRHMWDRERLSAETISLLRAHGPAVREHVVTDVVPSAEGPALLADLAARRRHVIQAVLTCGDHP